MHTNDRVIVATLSLLILSILTISSYFIYKRGLVEAKKIDLQDSEQEYTLENVQVLGIDDEIEEKEYPSINICYEDNCYYILPEIVETFYKDKQLDSAQLYIYLLENVISYFEKESGGKELFENKNGKFYAWKEDLIIDTSNIYKGVEKLLLNREEYDFVLDYKLYKKDMPGTDGKYAKKYIEVDNSKQRLYAWIDGKLIKEIKLSAAQRGFEVYGVFPIIDKGIQPMAPSGHYMPYWMAFYRSDWQHSWYGLHGLVWWYDDAGNKIFENTEYIGVRRSKGCIRMLKDDAKYLYDRYERGDLILIHE